MQLRIYTSLLLCLLLPFAAAAQNGINSLYSAYGIGDVEERDYSHNFGLSSTGIARKSTTFLNELNPASYSALPNQQFAFDVAFRAQFMSYKNSSISQSAADFNFRRLAIGFKASKRWGISAGFTPFSSVDYKLLDTRSITGTAEKVTSQTEGSGGLNRLYISNGYQLSKNFSVGVSTAFIFGPVNISEKIDTDTLFTKRNKYTFSPNFTAGLQYSGKIGKWELGLGATYRFQTNLTMNEKLKVTNLNDEVYFETELASSSLVLPAQIGTGISLSNGTVRWMADYRLQQWDGINQPVGNYKYVNASRVSTGLEYAFKRYYYDGYVDGIILQAGFSYNQSGLQIRGTRIKDLSGTAGISVPSRNGATRYYLGVEAGQRGTSTSGLVKETYINLLFNLSLKDLWFVKRKAL